MVPLALQALAEQQQASDMQQERELRRQGQYMAAAAAEAVIRECAERKQSLDQVAAALLTVEALWRLALLVGGCQRHAFVFQWPTMPGQLLTGRWLLATPLLCWHTISWACGGCVGLTPLSLQSRSIVGFLYVQILDTICHLCHIYSSDAP